MMFVDEGGGRWGGRSVLRLGESKGVCVQSARNSARSAARKARPHLIKRDHNV